MTPRIKDFTMTKKVGPPSMTAKKTGFLRIHHDIVSTSALNPTSSFV